MSDFETGNKLLRNATIMTCIHPPEVKCSWQLPFWESTICYVPKGAEVLPASDNTLDQVFDQLTCFVGEPTEH